MAKFPDQTLKIPDSGAFYQRCKSFTTVSITVAVTVGTVLTLSVWLYSASRSKVAPLAYLRHPIRKEKSFSISTSVSSRLSELEFSPNAEEGPAIFLASSILRDPTGAAVTPIKENQARVSPPVEFSGLQAVTFTDNLLENPIMSINSRQSHIVTVGESVETGKAMAHIWTYLPPGIPSSTPEEAAYFATLMRTFELEPITGACVDIAEDTGSFAVSGQTQTTARIWIGYVPSRGIELARPSQFEHEISVESLPTAMVFSPDGRTLATAHENDTVHLWDVDKGEKIRQLTYKVPSPPRSTFERAITFSADGSLVAMVDSSAIYLWETDTGKLLNTMTLTNEEGTNIWGHTRSLVVSHSNQWVASDAGHSNKIYFWDIASGELLRILYSSDGDFLALSPDDRQLAVGTEFGELTLWNLPEQLH